jgi:hypothetical protein
VRSLICQRWHAKHDRRSVSFPKWIVCLTLWGCSWTVETSAAPITWAYTGSITGSPDESVVSVGTPVTFQVTVDPEENFVAGSPFYPPWAGGYWVDLHLDFSGLHYDFRGAFEVNMDLLFGQPFPGQIWLRHIRWWGPDLFDRRADCGPPPCLFPFFALGVDGASSALPPLPFDPFGFVIPFVRYDPLPQQVQLRISGHDPQLVPEFSSVVLVATGVLGLTLVRRRALAHAIQLYSTRLLLQRQHRT